jgi:outer membrane protein
MKVLSVITSLMVCVTALHAQSQAPFQTLSLKEYIAIALKNNLQIRSSAAQYQNSRISIDQSRARILPRVSGSGGAGVSQSFSHASGLWGSPSNSYSAGISVGQTLFAFGKNLLQLHSAALSSEASEQDFTGTRQATVVNAENAYYNYLLALEVLRVSQDIVNQANSHLDQAKALVEVGRQAAYTITQANVDLANAQVNLVSARSDVKITKLQLDITAGIPLADSLVLTDSLAGQEPELSLEDALAMARATRPDYLAAKIRFETAKIQVMTAQRAYLPELDASGGVGYRGSDGLPGSSSWNAGVSLSVPIYSGGSVTASYASAKASAEIASVTLALAEQSLQNDIQQYYLQKIEAGQRIDATGQLLQKAREGLNLSEERYLAGLGTSLEITDARASYANAAISHAQALYNYHVAHIRLLGAAGAISLQ